MTPAKHRYSDEAKRDLAGIRAYLKQQASDAIAARMMSRLKDAVARMRNMPLAGAPRRDYRPNCRFVVEDPYLIYYDFDGERARSSHPAQARDRDRIMGGGE